jgi:hypothetical protein
VSNKLLAPGLWLHEAWWNAVELPDSTSGELLLLIIVLFMFLLW